jgi:hypothetical protein
MPRKNRYASITRALLAAAAVLLASCSESAPAGPHARTAPAESAEFFLAAVEYFAGRSAVPVRVDPRPLKADALLHSVGHGDLLLADHRTIGLRTAALATRGIPRADAPQDWRCVFATGLRPSPGRGTDPLWEQIHRAEPDSLRERRELCRARGEYVSLAFGPPQAGTQPGHPRRWRIRAMRMLLHGWEVVDLFLEPDSKGEWQVVSVQERVGAFS